MSAKTQFSQEDFIAILRGYELGTYVDSRVFDSGADQTNILLLTSTGKYAFRYYEKRSTDYVRFEIDLLHYLAEHSYPSPAPIKNGHIGYIGEYKGRPYALFEFLEGDHADLANHVNQMAVTIGKLHVLTNGYKPKHAEDRDARSVEYCWSCATASAEKVTSKIEAASRLSWMKIELAKLQLPDEMPKGVFHGDPNFRISYTRMEK